MTDNPKLLARLLQRRPLTVRRAAIVICIYTALITSVGAAVARLADRSEFHSFGTAVWWAVQTVTSVGYGDIAPHTTLGRAVAGLLMTSGLAFLAVITATVTAALLDQTRIAKESREGREQRS